MTGWQCPGCSRCYAPFIPMCHYCGVAAITTNTLTAGPYMPTTCSGCGKTPCDHSATGCPPILMPSLTVLCS